MKRLFTLLFAIVAVLLAAAPIAAAEPAMPHTGRVVISTEGDVTVPAGDQADLVVVTSGTATIGGDVNTVVVADGRLVLDGSTVESVIAVRTRVTVAGGAVVLGSLHTLDSEVTRLGNARIDGGVRDIGADLAGVGLFLGPTLVLLFLGLTIVAVAAALLLAGLAARQVRVAEATISREPLTVLAAGIAGIVLPILLAVPLFITVVGAPLALAILIGVLPAAAFVGYLVAAIWIGDWLLGRLGPRRERERPYLAAVIGVLVLQVLAIWPFLSGIAGLFGYGALLVVVWRTLRGSATQATPVAPSVAPALQGS